MPATVTTNEYERRRLDALHDCGILDTPPDKDFDSITSLAAAIFGVPIALISFVTQDRQWFKSKVGLDISETPRTASFCDSAILGNEVMVVTDATRDQRFAHHALVTGDTGICFYAGAPLVTAEGYALGTLCLVDRVAREFSQQQRTSLMLLSAQVVTLIALRKKSTALADALLRLENLHGGLEASQSKMRESEQRLTFALDAAEIGDWNMDLMTNVAVRSLQHDRCFGYTEPVPQWGYDTFLAHVHPADRQRVDANYAKAIGGHGNYDVEFRVMWPDGTEHWLWSRGRFYFDDEGKAYRVAGIQVEITKRRHADSVSRYNEERYRQLVDNSSDAILQITPNGAVLTANPAACALFAITEDDFIKRGRNGIVDTSDVRLAALLQMRSATGHGSGELRMRRGGGNIFDADIRSSLYVDPHGVTMGSVVIRDVTERKRSEERLQLAASVFSNALEGIVITDAEANIVDVNKSFCVLTGYSREELLGKNPRIIKSDRHDASFYSAMWRDLIADGQWSGEKWNRHRDGHIFAVQTTITAVADAHGQVKHYVSVNSDITRMKAQHQQLEHIAHYDALTNLPNRVLLADRLQQAMSQCQRRQQILAVAFLDIDGFKAINDAHGHAVGDQVLIELARRMKNVLRDGDTLSRFGGDEFVAILVDLDQAQDCHSVLRRVLQAASSTISVGEVTVDVSASIGVTLFPQDASDADQLLRHADQAMYAAKREGKNQYRMFDVAQDSAAKSQRDSLEEIRAALQRKEFVLYYQPKVNIRTGEVTGAEALIRWQHPQRGLLSPAAFLPLIENSPIEIEIGEWVIVTALTQISQWQLQGLDIPVSVNISAQQLQRPDFSERLAALLESATPVATCRLEMEILESSAFANILQVIETLKRCRQMGVRFALDDFGTGYSSMTYLKAFPIDVLKIDQSFVINMLGNKGDHAIVQSVIELAKAFELKVIAEGVETAAHGTMLSMMGCESAQGYGIARPMPAGDFCNWAQTWRAGAHWADGSGT
ncbi:MAG: EAL domain-containing protein [Herminiimonas sp.]|nr:EAL domain-containing protein [Herminiimonas sp.]